VAGLSAEIRFAETLTDEERQPPFGGDSSKGRSR
jgi:hypothetical protein